MNNINNYHEPKWERLRKRALVRDKYIDRYQARYGKYRNADLVHHIFPVKEFPEYQYELWNLISVSKSTHALFHDRTTDELTEIGQDVLRRLCKQRNMEIPSKYQKTKEKKSKIKYLQWY